MRISLSQLNSQALAFDLPGADGAPGPRISVSSFVGFRGTVVQENGVLELSKLAIERVGLDDLRLVFGALLLHAAGDSLFNDVAGAFRRDSERIELDARAKAVDAQSVRIEVGAVHLRSELSLESMRLRQEQDGVLQAKRAHLRGFELHVGAVDVHVEDAWLENVHVGWGRTGFWLEAKGIEASLVRFNALGSAMEARGVTAKDVTFRDGVSRARRIAIERILGELRWAGSRKTTQRPPPRTKGAARLRPFDLAVLDGLSGEVDVDVGLDLTVPVIGRRRATHRLRIPIDHGAIDYMSLERDLSALESSLLDFSLRDHALVLERGIPLLPTRGRGKPIARWRLDARDYALAEKHRVRLAVLPSIELEPSSSDEASTKGNASKGKIALRELRLRPIDVRLRLTEKRDLEGWLRALTFQSFELRGKVSHPPQGDGSKEGRLRAKGTSIRLAIAGAALGASELRQLRLRLGGLEDLDLRLDGLSPRLGRLELRDVVVDDLDVGPGTNPHT